MANYTEWRLSTTCPGLHFKLILDQSTPGPGKVDLTIQMPLQNPASHHPE